MPDGDPWNVEFAPRAVRQRRALSPRDQGRVSEAIEQLALGAENVDLRKLHGRADDWAIRVGNFRVLFRFRRRERTVYVLEVLHRHEAYRERS